MDWLEWIAQGFGLFQSGIWFIGGLVLCLVGAIMVGDSLAFRRRAYKAKVLCLGVIPNTTNEEIRRAYHPVYQYTTRDGESLTMKSPSARSLPGNLRNTWRTLMVDSEDKYDLRGTFPWQLLGGILVLLWGFGFFKIASITGRGLLWAGVACLLLISARFIYAVITSPRSVKAASRLNRRNVGIRVVKPAPQSFEMSDVMSEREHWRAILIEDWRQLKIVPLILLLAIPLLVFGGDSTYRRFDLTVNGQRTVGRVIRIESEGGSESTSYYSTAQFSDQAGKKHEVRDSVGSSTPVDERGDEVTVLYDTVDPTRALIHRGFWSWLWSGGLLFLGVLFLGYCVATIKNYFQRRKIGREVLAASAENDA